MRVVFLGTPEFAVPALKTLLQSPYEVAAVITQPDKPAGRGNKPQYPPVKVVALASGIPVHQPEKIRNEETKPLILQLRPDFIVVVAYGQILPGWLLQSASIAPVNIHGSLLPKFRGAAPVAWALLKGETVTGITTMLMDEHLDTGGILLQRQIDIGSRTTAGELSETLSRLGAEMIIPTLDGLRTGELKPIRQDDNLASWAPRIQKEQAQIDWSVDAAALHNQIRAFNPWPLAYATCHDARVQLIRSVPRPPLERSEAPPGTYIGVTTDGLCVACGSGSILEILELKPANRKIVTGRQFANGLRLRPDAQLFTTPVTHPEPLP